jgi:1,5-anhydro-D-fructose reductase (1,5-anhydro-D-mannitol-forming)
MIRVGVVGLGFMGRTHYTRLQQQPDVVMTAVADRETERRKAAFSLSGNIDVGLGELNLDGVQVVASAEELIAMPDVDVVDICLPTFLHPKYVVMALENGKHVICEKPMALTAAEAEAMVAAAHKARKNLFIAQVLRFWPEYQYLRQVIKSGDLGKLLFLSMMRRTAGGAPSWHWDDWNKDTSRSGGVLDIRIHDTDFVQFVLGLPDSVSAVAIPGLHIVQGLFNYKDGPQVTIESNRVTPVPLGFEDGFQAVFEKGTMRYSGQFSPKLRIFRTGAREPECPEISGDAYEAEIRYFIDCLRAGTDGHELADPESALLSLKLWEMEKESIQKGKVIEVKN